ncbi:MAG: thioredoxin fold domain-containing protein [Burkholderiaceae bacterium]
MTTATPLRQRALPTTTSLRESAAVAARQGEPLVVMTTLDGCPFCDLVRQHLVPMRDQGRVHAVQIDIRDRQTALDDFQGRPSTPAEQASRYKARFAPTVLFLGPGGQELAERLVGMAVPELYGGYLDGRLDEARSRLRKA